MVNVGHFAPTRGHVEAFDVGDFAPDCFGRSRRIVEVVYRGEDVNGRAFVGVRLDFGDKSTITASYKENTVHRVATAGAPDSAAYDRIEATIRAERGDDR